MEFVQLSATGKEMLSDLVAELAKLQALMRKLKSERRETDAESFRKEMEDGKLQLEMLTGTMSDRFPFLATILTRDKSKPDPAGSDSREQTPKSQPLVISVDLFG